MRGELLALGSMALLVVAGATRRGGRSAEDAYRVTFDYSNILHAKAVAKAWELFTNHGSRSFLDSLYEISPTAFEDVISSAFKAGGWDVKNQAFPDGSELSDTLHVDAKVNHVSLEVTLAGLSPVLTLTLSFPRLSRVFWEE